jgi:hypothetical protein
MLLTVQLVGKFLADKNTRFNFPQILMCIVEKVLKLAFASPVLMNATPTTSFTYSARAPTLLINTYHVCLVKDHGELNRNEFTHPIFGWAYLCNV